MRYLLLIKVIYDGAADIVKALLARDIKEMVRSLRLSRNKIRVWMGLEPLEGVCLRCGDLLLPQMEDPSARGGFYCICRNPFCGAIVRLPPPSGPPRSGWWR